MYVSVFNCFALRNYCIPFTMTHNVLCTYSNGFFHVYSTSHVPLLGQTHAVFLVYLMQNVCIVHISYVPTHIIYTCVFTETYIHTVCIIFHRPICKSGHPVQFLQMLYTYVVRDFIHPHLRFVHSVWCDMTLW